MGDYDSMIPELKGEENLIAAAKHIVKALGSNKNLTVDARKILAELGTQLSTMTAVNETKDDGTSEIEDRLHSVEEKHS
jgi:exocyst complex protein 7